MAERYFSKFRFTDKFDHLPEQMELNARGYLMLTRTKIDMVPARLKGVFFVFLGKKPRYVAPDFEGSVIYGSDRWEYMDNLEIQAAKARYAAYCDAVEAPRYVEEDGTLSLCSLPTDMRIFTKLGEGYCLDLTRTSIRKTQNLGGFKEVILYPKKPVQPELPLVFPQKIATHHNSRPLSSGSKTYGED